MHVHQRLPHECIQLIVEIRLRPPIPWALRRDRDAAAQAIMRRSRGAIALNRAGRDRGFSATLLGAGPRGALGFGIFETLKPIVADAKRATADAPGLALAGQWLEQNGWAGKFLCGYWAGFLSEFFICAC